MKKSSKKVQVPLGAPLSVPVVILAAKGAKILKDLLKKDEKKKK